MNLSDKARPVRRVWIPKPGKTEMRPLGIPTMMDRAKQALVKMVIEPEWEAIFEPNSYGFRPGRGCWDAIDAVWQGISKTTKWIWMPTSQAASTISTIRPYYKSSTPPRASIDASRHGSKPEPSIKPDSSGRGRNTTRGRDIPLLANIALHGMEAEVKAAMGQDLRAWYNARGYKGRRNSLRSLTCVRYADDFIFAHNSKEIIEKLRP